MIGKPLSLDDQEVSSIFAGLLGRASLADQLLRSHLNGPFFIILLNHDLVRFIVEFEFADIAQGIRESMIPTGSVLGQFLGPAVGIAEPTLQAARTFERRMPSRDGDAGA